MGGRDRHGPSASFEDDGESRTVPAREGVMSGYETHVTHRLLALTDNPAVVSAAG
jgi:hypothetical protein